MPTTSPSSAPPSRLPLVERLRHLIITEPFGPGARLPSEADLGKLLGVSRTLVRPTLELLQQEGLVQILSAKVRVVAGTPIATTTSGVIALVTRFRHGAPEEDHFRMRINVFWGLMAALSAQRRPVLIQQPANEAETTVRALEAMAPAGCIVLEDAWRKSGTGMDELLAALVAAEIPSCVHGELLPAAAPLRVPTVCSDHARGARLIVEALAQRGVRRILIQDLAQPELRWKRARRIGYERACADLGIEIVATLPVMELPGTGAAHHQLRSQAHVGILMPYLDRVDAIIAASDSPCPPLIGACRLLGRRPGTDILVTGYDNYFSLNEAWPFEPTPPVFTIDKRGDAVGAALLSAMHGERNAREILVEPRLITPGVPTP